MFALVQVIQGPRCYVMRDHYFFLGSPIVKVVALPFVMRKPSGAMVALRMRNLISLFMSPDFVVGTFPVAR